MFQVSELYILLISIKTFLINYNYPRVHEDKIHLGEGENDL